MEMDVKTESSGINSSNNNISCKFYHSANNDKNHETFDATKVLSHDGEKSKKKTKWSKKQLLLLIISMLANFGSASCSSLQAPFFPAEAEKKGVTPTVYGFIFSSFSFTVFILAPLYGKYMEKIGATFLMNSGLFVVAICCILFGQLDKIDSTNSFTTLAFLVRIVEAAGDAAFHTANFTKMTSICSSDLGRTFAFLRASYGVGLITGPAVGGVLYEFGGYTLPFATMGTILLLLAITTTVLFWNEKDEISKHSDSSIIKVLLIPSVALSMIAVSFGALSIGFLNATLEPHLRQFNLNPIEVGFIFIISGVVYAPSSILWGWLGDGKVPSKLLIASGGAFMCLTYLLIGPAPFMPFDSLLPLVIISLIFHGFALGAELVASYIHSLRQTIANGFPESYQTYGMISGFWASFLELGNVFGPSLGGILLDQVGFREATVVLISLQFLLMITNIAYYFVFDHRATKVDVTENVALLN